MDTETLDFKTFDAPAGERLDVAISMRLELPRSYAKELVDEGYVQLNGRPVGKPGARLNEGEIVTVMLPPPRPVMVEPEDIPLDIIYQDSDLAVINKPPDLIAHPTNTVRTGTVVNALLGRIQLSKDGHFDPKQDDYRPGIVHRLDKDTSGVMVIAKNDTAHRHLSNSFKKRLTEKEYVAIAVGDIKDDVHVDAAIGRHPVNRQKMTVGGTSPRSASTRFRVLDRIAGAGRARGYALVKAKPRSGRTHQIRVHLAHLDAPVLGDVTYGRSSDVVGRQALHAARLTLPHPRDNQAITFSAQVPVDMVEAWLRLGGAWPPTGEDSL